MRFILSYLLFLVILLLSYSGMAQQSSYVQYTVNDGLPSNHVYQALQDKKGYMWFATEGGVAKFDGRNWKKFTTKDGLPTNDIYQMVEDGNGRIWLRGVSNIVSYIEGDSVSIFNPEAYGYLDCGLYSYIHYNGKDMIIGYRNCILNINNIYELENSFDSEDRELIDEIKDTYFTDYKENCNIFTLYELFFLEGGNTIKILNRCGDILFETELNMELETTMELYMKDNMFYKNNLYLISKDRSRIVVFNTITGKFLEEIIFMDYFDENPSHVRYEISDSTIQLQTNLGVIIYNINEQTPHCHEKYKIDYDSYFNSKEINRVFRDKEKNIWVLSKNKGITMIPFYLMNNFSNELLNISAKSLVKVKDKIVYGDNLGKLYYSNQTIPFLDLQYNVIDNTINQLYYDSIENELLLMKDGQGLVFNNLDNHEISRLFNSGQYRYESKIDLGLEKKFQQYTENQGALGSPFGFNIINDKLYYSCGNRLLKINKNNWLIDSILFGHDIRKTIDSKEQLYLVSNEQIIVSDSLFNQKGISTFPNAITDVKPFKEGVLVLLFNTEVYYLKGTNSKKLVYEAEQPSVGNKLIVENNNVWIASNTGLYMYECANDTLKLKRFQILRGINDLLIEKDSLYAATDNGLMISSRAFDDDLVTQSPINIELSDLITGKKMSNTKNFKYSENNIEIKFEYLNYSCDGDYEVKMKLMSEDTISLSSSNNEFSFPNLAPDTYEVQYYALDNMGRRSQMQTYHFTIKKPWWLTKEFYIAVASLLGIITYLIYIFSVNRIKKKEEQQTEINRKMAELKLSALQSQMNPHFIFNSLNSIQHLIQSNEIKNADAYLYRFSHLLRLFLENSSQKFVSISKELEILTNYTDLELLRFENKFKLIYENTLTEEECKTIKIPTNILQPIVENSLNHGLFHKGYGGILTISINSLKDKICIEIIDNGIGREAAAAIKKKSIRNYQSLGGKILTEKLDVLSRVNNYRSDIQYQDLVNANNEAEGTKVTITFPIEYNLKLES